MDAYHAYHAGETIMKGTRSYRTLATVLLACLALSLGTGCSANVSAATVTPITLKADSPPALATYAIVDTGQTQCYDSASEIDCPAEGEAFSGQDAQYDGNQPSYTENDDGTVTDCDTDAGERIIDAQYASSTEYVATTMNRNETMFGVNFADGVVSRAIQRGRCPDSRKARDSMFSTSGAILAMA